MRADDAYIYDLVIVGAGPAGCAAAIRAAMLRPDLRSRILLLDRARFPRVKVCGGGLVKRTAHMLQRLGIQPDVPTTSVDAATFIFPDRRITISRRAMFHVVRREEFDAALLQHARRHGISVREGTAVVDLIPERGGMVVRTEDGDIRARVVIGADGATGVTRRAVLSGRRHLSMVGLETFTAMTRWEREHQMRHHAIFDFRCMSGGVEGYSWDFPAGRDEQPLVNRGIFHSHTSGGQSRVSLKSYLMRSLHERGIPADPDALKGHPAHMYDPSLPCSAPHILLAGDAIGVEPLLGEGISSALETGILAADTACRALQRGDLSFHGYADLVRGSAKGRTMRFKRRAAERFYAGQPRWWFLLGAVGVGGLYTRAVQTWTDLTDLRESA